MGKKKGWGGGGQGGDGAGNGGGGMGKRITRIINQTASGGNGLTTTQRSLATVFHLAYVAPLNQFLPPPSAYTVIA